MSKEKYQEALFRIRKSNLQERVIDENSRQV